ncbi:MAG TPA: hypothetical protein VGV15_02465 [Terriglobales bacterium]|nr:hypothetical protein [Terriglobales bacterium]
MLPPAPLYAIPGLSANIIRMGILVTVAIRLIEGMFAIGAIGSFIVLILTAIEDIETLAGVGDSKHTEEQPT